MQMHVFVLYFNQEVAFCTRLKYTSYLFTKFHDISWYLDEKWQNLTDLRWPFLEKSWNLISLNKWKKWLNSLNTCFKIDIMFISIHSLNVFLISDEPIMHFSDFKILKTRHFSTFLDISRLFSTFLDASSPLGKCRAPTWGGTFLGVKMIFFEKRAPSLYF